MGANGAVLCTRGDAGGDTGSAAAPTTTYMGAVKASGAVRRACFCSAA